MNLHRMVRVATAVATFSIITVMVASGARAKDLGDEPRYAAQKGRHSGPGKREIDPNVSLRGLLEGRDEHTFDTGKGATITGYVIQVEREWDGDVHLVLADAARETSTLKWVIVEITPSWQKRGGSFSTANLRGLVGHRVKVTGWLYYEPDTQSEDPRGTRWELHPVTSITRVD